MKDAYYNMDPATRAAIEDNAIDRLEQYHKRRDKLLESFAEGKHRYNTQSQFRAVIESLSRGAEPLEIIDALIRLNFEQSERIKEYLTHHAHPRTNY